jgi:hypothetical protein
MELTANLGLMHGRVGECTRYLFYRTEAQNLDGGLFYFCHHLNWNGDLLEQFTPDSFKA